MKTLHVNTKIHNRISIDDKEYFIYQKNDKAHIIPTRCPHRGGPLHYGISSDDGEFISCPWHDNKFKLNKLRCNNLGILHKKNSVTIVAEAETMTSWFEANILDTPRGAVR